MKLERILLVSAFALLPSCIQNEKIKEQFPTNIDYDTSFTDLGFGYSIIRTKEDPDAYQILMKHLKEDQDDRKK